MSEARLSVHAGEGRGWKRWKEEKSRSGALRNDVNKTYFFPNTLRFHFAHHTDHLFLHGWLRRPQFRHSCFHVTSNFLPLYIQRRWSCPGLSHWGTIVNYNSWSTNACQMHSKQFLSCVNSVSWFGRAGITFPKYIRTNFIAYMRVANYWSFLRIVNITFPFRIIFLRSYSFIASLIHRLCSEFASEVLITVIYQENRRLLRYSSLAHNHVFRIVFPEYLLQVCYE